MAYMILLNKSAIVVLLFASFIIYFHLVFHIKCKSHPPAGLPPPLFPVGIVMAVLVTQGQRDVVLSHRRVHPYGQAGHSEDKQRRQTANKQTVKMGAKYIISLSRCLANQKPGQIYCMKETLAQAPVLH